MRPLFYEGMFVIWQNAIYRVAKDEDGDRVELDNGVLANINDVLEVAYSKHLTTLTEATVPVTKLAPDEKVEELPPSHVVIPWDAFMEWFYEFAGGQEPLDFIRENPKFHVVETKQHVVRDLRDRYNDVSDRVVVAHGEGSVSPELIRELEIKKSAYHNATMEALAEVLLRGGFE